MIKSIILFLKNNSIFQKVKNLEKENDKRKVEIDMLRLLCSSQTTVISHLVKGYQDLHDSISSMTVINLSDSSYSEDDIDQLYKNFISTPPSDDDLLN